MYYLVNKIEQGVYQADGLQNPQIPGQPMVLGVYRRLIRTALFNLHPQKAFGEFWYGTDQKKVDRRLWSADMHAFAARKVAEAPKPPYNFKITIAGWIFILLMAAVFAMVVYERVKPPAPKSAAYVAMGQALAVGDVEVS